MYQLGFVDGEVRSNLPFLKRAEIVFVLAVEETAYQKIIAEL